MRAEAAGQEKKYKMWSNVRCQPAITGMHTTFDHIGSTINIMGLVQLGDSLHNRLACLFNRY